MNARWSLIYASLILLVSSFASFDKHNAQHCHSQPHYTFIRVLEYGQYVHVSWFSDVPILLAFDDEHCWEPYMPHGNFSSSDISYQLGTTVTFACSPGFIMEQGSGTIECIDPSNPHWNNSEPVCKGNFHSFSFGCTVHSTIFANVYYEIPFELTRKLQPTLLLNSALPSGFQQGDRSS